MIKKLIHQLEDGPVIAAVKCESDLAAAINEGDVQVIFLLYGDICTITDTVKTIKDSGKMVIVHMDLIEGLENKAVAVRFIRESTEADGIISTKASIIKAAKEVGLITVQRFFVIDSIAISNIHKQLESGCADMIEVLPGVIPKIIKKLNSEIDVPIIAGGLLSDKEDVIQALSAGAIAVSTTRKEIWKS